MGGTSSQPSALPDSLRHKLDCYALAAGAAGVGMLALAQPAEGRVVYTKTHQVIGPEGIYLLDLNHDGTIDLLIQRTTSYRSASLRVKAAFGNGVEGSGNLAAALKQGAIIGPRQTFVNTSSSRGEIMAASFCSDGGSCGPFGPWANVHDRYLGLKFRIDGKEHYGWARLNVNLGGFNIIATLTGYAYETIPRKSLLAGATHGEDKGGTVLSRSLGHLALGAWRRP